MDTLNLPQADLKIKSNKRYEVWDIIRKKYVALGPEEWVRQHMIHYLVNYLQYPALHIGVEASLKVNRMSRRADILVFGPDGKPRMLIECKAADVNLNQTVIDQAARYNISLEVPYLVVSNGLMHYSMHIDHQNESYRFLDAIPSYQDLYSP